MTTDSLGLPAPTPIALVICDNVFTDRGGKRALVGLFNKIVARNIPIKQTKVCVFVSITSLRPQTKCKLDIIHAESDETIFETKEPVPMQEKSPTAICDLVFELNGIVFPEEGRYIIRFFGNDTLIVQRPFEVIRARPRKPKP